ncbi:MAG: FMN-binding negative transcriptional regulator [Gammaproteobacteria bacterium]
MDTAPSKYAPPGEADVVRLTEQYPLAWVASAADGDFAAAPLPLRPRTDSSGRLVEIHGHFARSNPQVAQLRRVPRALLLFMGPQSYASPSWLGNRTWAPTWNSASAAFVADLELIEDAPRTEALMHDLVDAMERGRERAWSIAEMGERYRRIVSGIIGFHARIVSRSVRFKLGQDERDEVYAEMTAGLAREGKGELLAWMARSNPGR